MLLALLAIAGCSKYDDSALRKDVEELQDRVNSIEKWQTTVNNDLSTLRTIVDALNGKDYITSIDVIQNPSGKVIGFKATFAKSGSKEIYFGEDSTVPVIGIKIDSDGEYYWTLDGEWMYDKEGNRMPVQGMNGIDIATPLINIIDGYWQVSYDSGKTWERLGSVSDDALVTGLFKDVIVSEEIVTFVLKDGSRFAVPLVSDLSIKFEDPDQYFLSPNTSIEIGYEIRSSTGKADIELITSSEVKAELVPNDETKLKGRIRVSAGEGLSLQPKVVVLVTDGYRMLMRSFEFEHAQIQIKDNSQKEIESDGGQLALEYFSNVDCVVDIPEDAKSWLSITSTKALTKRTIQLNVAKNNGDRRSATVTIRNGQGDLKVNYTISQAACYSIAFGKGNAYMPGAGQLSIEYVSSDPAHPFSNMVDGKDATYYVTDKTVFNVIWEGEEAVSPKNYRIDFGSDSSVQPEGVTILTSNDGEQWDFMIGYGSSYFGNLQLDFPSTSKVRFIKFQITNDTGPDEVRIHEIRINAFEGNSLKTFSDLKSRGSGFSTSSQTPMGNHYENRHVTTASDKTWLANPDNEPKLLPSASQYTLKPQSVTLYPHGTPLPADVNQHGIGDCSALAVFAEMAYIFPDFIKSIITANSDGTFTVAMFDPQGKPVDVCIKPTFLSESNGSIGASTGKNGEANWATVLEKAIMKWNYIYEVNPDITGIGSEHVAPLFTGDGDSFAISPGTFDNADLKLAAELSLEERMIVIGGFNVGGLWAGTGSTVTAHAYSFMYSTDASALFSMRNPWGFSPNSDGKEDGVLNIPDNSQVPPAIDMRIINPGKAKDYALKTLAPYVPPTN